jgi:hypothetical protein
MTFNITIKQSDSEKRPASTVVLQGVHYFCVSSLPNTFFKVCFVKKYISIKRSHLFSRDSSLLRLLSQERLNVEIDHHPTNKSIPARQGTNTNHSPINAAVIATATPNGMVQAQRMCFHAGRSTKIPTN